MGERGTKLGVSQCKIWVQLQRPTQSAYCLGEPSQSGEKIAGGMEILAAGAPIPQPVYVKLYRTGVRTYTHGRASDGTIAVTASAVNGTIALWKMVRGRAPRPRRSLTRSGALAMRLAAVRTLAIKCCYLNGWMRQTWV